MIACAIQTSLMNEVGCLMGEYNMYLEHMEPVVYLERFREVLNKLRYMGKTMDVSAIAMQSMWEESLRVTANSVEQAESSHSDSDDSDGESSSKKKGKARKGETCQIIELALC